MEPNKGEDTIVDSGAIILKRYIDYTNDLKLLILAINVMDRPQVTLTIFYDFWTPQGPLVNLLYVLEID